MKNVVSAEVMAVHRSCLIVDLHCDLLLSSYFLGWDWNRRHAPNPLPGAPLMGHCDLPRLEEGNVGCMALGIVTNPLRAASGPDAIRHDLMQMQREADRSEGKLCIAGNVDAVRQARGQGKIACFAGLEGAHGLNGKLDDLPEFYKLGLRYVTLCHFSRNVFCSPMVGWGADNSAALTTPGHALVEALNSLGILVDLAHVGEQAFLDAAKRSTKPVICSHSAAKAVWNSPRGIADAQLRAVAETDGVVGVIFVTPFIGPGGAEQVAAHLDHFRTTIGIRHCAIGSDWEGFALYPSELSSADQLPLLTQALLRRGWKQEEIQAVYGENFLRVIGAA
jgi:membrane dipeptidase